MNSNILFLKENHAYPKDDILSFTFFFFFLSRHKLDEITCNVRVVCRYLDLNKINKYLTYQAALSRMHCC